MNKKNIDYLYDKYREMFSVLENGIKCNDGWLLLIDTFCWYILTQYPYINFLVIKKQNGRLKIRLSDYPNGIQSIVEFIEFLSFGICEICGSTIEVDTFMTNNDAMTVCSKCKIKECIDGAKK
jgi:hypothetical protein